MYCNFVHLADNTCMERQVIDVILRDQRQELIDLLGEEWCHRPEESLINLNSRLAQVVIGVRRSGKSILCINVIKNSGLVFGYMNFEDERLSAVNSNDLNMMLECLYQIYGSFDNIFLDEIQNVEGWQYFVNRLLRSGMHVLMTGSNAKLLSSELSTHMAGRYMPIELYPFSFAEYCEVQHLSLAHGSTKEKGLLRKAFDNYIHDGGFPELINERRKEAYVQGLVSGILTNDIEKRYKIAYKEAFERMAQHLMNIAPSKINYADISSLFGFRSKHTAANYVGYLEKAYLMCLISKFSYKSQKRIQGNKAYTIDISLMNMRRDAFASENLGWRLESIVLIELLRRGRPEGLDIAYWEERSSECDFLVCRGRDVIAVVQVSYDISNERTLKREIKGLVSAAQKTGCRNLLLITDYEDKVIEESGFTIRIVPAYAWLADRKPLEISSVDNGKSRRL